MARMDVGAAFGPACEHTVRVLFRPFVFGKWLALGFVSLLSYGGMNFHANFPGPGGGTPSRPGAESEWILQHLPLVIAGLLAVLAIIVLLAWLSSVLSLVYVDQITRSSAAIREPFARLKGLGKSFLLWQLGFVLAILILGGLLALPIVWAFSLPAGASIAIKILVVVAAVVIGIPLLILMMLVALFARDFVVPTMYARGVKVIEAWRVVLGVIRTNAGQTALYALCLIPINLGMLLASVVVLVVLAVVFAIPVGLLALGSYLIWQAAHLTWTTLTIGVVVALAVMVVAALTYVGQCVLQPAIVFRRAFALAMIGQADESLVTIPIGQLPNTASPQPIPGE